MDASAVLITFMILVSVAVITTIVVDSKAVKVKNKKRPK